MTNMKKGRDSYCQNTMTTFEWQLMKWLLYNKLMTFGDKIDIKQDVTNKDF